MMAMGNTGSPRSDRDSKNRRSAVWQRIGIPVCRETSCARAAPLRISAGVVSPHRWVLFTRPEQVRPVTASMERR